MELLIGVGVLVAFALLTLVARWGALRWLHPAPRDVGNDARAGLAAAERVFGLAVADGGRLRYPWEDGEVTYREHELRLQIETVADRVPDSQLVRELTLVRDSLRRLFASAEPHTPFVWYDGMPTPPPNPAVEARRQRQLVAADTGSAAVESARRRLAVLERRARLWWAS